MSRNVAAARTLGTSSLHVDLTRFVNGVGTLSTRTTQVTRRSPLGRLKATDRKGSFSRGILGRLIIVQVLEVVQVAGIFRETFERAAAPFVRAQVGNHCICSSAPGADSTAVKCVAGDSKRDRACGG